MTERCNCGGQDQNYHAVAKLCIWNRLLQNDRLYMVMKQKSEYGEIKLFEPISFDIEANIKVLKTSMRHKNRKTLRRRLLSRGQVFERSGTLKKREIALLIAKFSQAVPFEQKFFELKVLKCQLKVLT